MLTDPIADMLTPDSQREQGHARHRRDADVAHEGADRARAQGRGLHQGLPGGRGDAVLTLVIELKFGKNRQRVITGLKRVSRPGRRVYARKDRLPRVLGGLGTAILSTSSGLVTNRQAAERGIGGEVIAFVW